MNPAVPPTLTEVGLDGKEYHLAPFNMQMIADWEWWAKTKPVRDTERMIREIYPAPTTVPDRSRLNKLADGIQYIANELYSQAQGSLRRAADKSDEFAKVIEKSEEAASRREHIERMRREASDRAAQSVSITSTAGLRLLNESVGQIQVVYLSIRENHPDLEPQDVSKLFPKQRVEEIVFELLTAAGILARGTESDKSGSDKDPDKIVEDEERSDPSTTPSAENSAQN